MREASDRRGFLGGAAMTMTAAKVAASASNASAAPLQTMKQVRAGALNVAYAELGPGTGEPVLLLHGWPYDIHSFDEAAPILAQRGFRVIVPFLRGYGLTRFLSADTMRNGGLSPVDPAGVRYPAGR